jgi:uncharacterized membrane protein YfcA
VPVPQAAAIMLPILMVADFVGITKLVRHADWKLIRLLMPAGQVGVVVGALLFKWLSAQAVTAMTGALALAFVFIRVARPARAEGKPDSRWLGRVLALLSGFTSFVAHAGSPPIGFYVLPLKLAPLVFSGTMAVFFAAINFAKWVPYGMLGLIDLRNMVTSLALVPFAVAGVWIGVGVVRRVSQVLFNRLFLLGMTLTGCKLLWDGLRGLAG